MRIIQKLEILSGIATFVAALLYFWFVVLVRIKRMEELGNAGKESELTNYVVLFVLTLLVMIGAYLHGNKRNIIGFALIILCGSPVSFLHFLAFLLGYPFREYALIGVSPGAFAFTTIVFGFVNSAVQMSAEDKSIQTQNKTSS